MSRNFDTSDRRALRVPDTVDEISRLGGWNDPYLDAQQDSPQIAGLLNAWHANRDHSMTLLEWVNQRDQEERSAGAAAEIDRCRREIAKIESQIRSSHPDILGLCQALADWNAELRLLEKEK